MRLDDACEKRSIEKWDRFENLLDKYNIKPLVGIIPECRDEQMEIYSEDKGFWNTAKRWEAKGWELALHGFDHVYTTNDGGINPVNARSEFAGLSLDEQKSKIKSGLDILSSHGISPKVFFAPSHTFDENTIDALKSESSIRIVSDTVAFSPYSYKGMTFVPQQTGRARLLPFSLVTFCYHPNIMEDEDFKSLESFLSKYRKRFIPFPTEPSERRKGLTDKLLSFLYFARR